MGRGLGGVGGGLWWLGLGLGLGLGGGGLGLGGGGLGLMGWGMGVEAPGGKGRVGGLGGERTGCGKGFGKRVLGLLGGGAPGSPGGLKDGLSEEEAAGGNCGGGDDAPGPAVVGSTRNVSMNMPDMPDDTRSKVHQNVAPLLSTFKLPFFLQFCINIHRKKKK